MNRNILRLAIPNIISNITVPLLGMVDMFIVGHMESEDYIGAIALATMIFNFMYWSFSFLRMGTSGFTAQAFGATDHREEMSALMRSLTVSFIGGLSIILLQWLIATVGFYFLDGGDTVKLYAKTYFYIYVWAAPAVLGLYTFNGWFVGMQNAKVPMVVAISINIVNILLSFLFVYGLGMKIEGVALASACAQYVGLFAFMIIWNLKYGWLKQYADFRLLKDIQSYLPFFKVNSDIFIRTMALIAVTTFFMSASAKLGADILAVNALLMQLFILFSYIMDGFAYAAEALTGRYIGARNRTQLKALVKYLFSWGFMIALLFTLIYTLCTDEILTILTDKQNIVDLSKQYHIWILLVPLAGFSAFLWDGIFVGATASRQMRNSMLIAVSVFFIVYFSFNNVKSNNILWMVFIVYLAVRGLVQTFMASTILNHSR